MALTASQIVARAIEIAKAPGYTSQAGQLLNAILQELAQTYDLDLCRGFYQFNFIPGLVSSNSNVTAGGGPYPLPADYLRAEKGDVFYSILGVPYEMINVDITEFDMMVQQAGQQSYPYLYCTDLSQSPPVLFVYPPPSGAYPVTVRYRRQMADIPTPESSAVTPWFPSDTYLIRRLAGEVMLLTDDPRATVFLGDSNAGAQGILRRYLKLADDKSSRSQRVTLDKRRFGRSFDSLPNTKTIGW